MFSNTTCISTLLVVFVLVKIVKMFSKRTRLSCESLNRSLGLGKYYDGHRRRSRRKPDLIYQATINPHINHQILQDSYRFEQESYDTQAASSNSSESNFSENEETREFLYCGSGYKLKDLVLVVLSFYKRHHLSQKALEDLLNILARFLPQPNMIPKSFYRFNKILKSLTPSVIIKKYCANCSKVRSQNKKNCDCVALAPISRRDCKILCFDSKSQFVEIAKRNLQDLIRPVQEYSGILEDVTVSPLYYKVISSINRTCIPITLTISTDGAPLTKTGSQSFWPLTGTVNEIGCPKRFLTENILVFGVWVGHIEPKIDSFFNECFCDIMKDFIDNPISISSNQKSYKFSIRIFSALCDIPAKALLLNIKNFNGSFGCPYCLHEGARNNPRIQEYPYRSKKYKAKTSEFYERETYKIATGILSEYGVKGKSVLADFMAVPNQIPIGYMHNILEGVLRIILLSPQLSNKAARTYLNRFIGVIKLPHDTCRKLDDFFKFSRWKASQIFLLLYTLPIFKWLDPEIFYYLSLVVSATRILLQPSIEQSELDTAEDLCRTAYRLTKKIFQQKESINIHMFGDHLVDQVREMGPLWAQAEFVFENCNKILKGNVQGTRGQDNSIARGVLWSCLATKFMHSTTTKAHDICKSILRPSSDKEKLKRRHYFALPPFPEERTQETYKFLVDHNLNSANTKICFRIILREEKYHSLGYTRSSSCNSYTVKFEHSGLQSYGNIHYYIVTDEDIYACIQKYEVIAENILFSTIPSPKDLHVKSLVRRGLVGQHYFPVRLLEEKLLISVRYITSRCIVSYDIPDLSDVCFITLYDIKRHFN